MKRIVPCIKYMSYVGIISCFLGCIYDGPYEMVPSLTPLREISCSTVNIDFGYYESSEEMSITVKGYDTHWSISGAPDWLTITPQSGYNYGDFNVTISAKANTSTESARTCVLTLKSDEPEYSYSKNIKVTQAKAPTFTGYKTFHAGNVTFKMMHVEAGTFQMGGTEYSNEQPVHSVTITKDYYIG
ncbi:MAG: BACON domain-containing protein, partial [Bacteroidaceae bacterium]